MISVLIPVYNGVEYLSESLTSVIDQTYTRWEVIIGINGHPPNSDVEEYANKVKADICNNDILRDKIRIIYYKTNGKSATLNAMVKDCSYDLVALLDVDDKWLPTKLERQRQYWDSYDVVGTTCQYFGDRFDSPNIPVNDISDFDFLKVNPVINCSAVLKKQCAYWNELNTVGLEDYELWLQLRLQNKKFYNIAETLCLHRIDKKSAFNNSNGLYVHQLLDEYRQIYN